MRELFHLTHLPHKISITMHVFVGRGKDLIHFNGILIKKKKIQCMFKKKKNHFIMKLLVGYVYTDCLNASLTCCLLF